MERNNRGRPRRTTLVILYQNSEFPNFFLKSPTTYLIPKKRSKWKNHEINGKKAEILWKIEKQESLKRDPRVPLRGQKEKFTLNSAARTLRIRVHSNEPSHPCRPVNIFFRASVCVCFFQPPRGGARSMQSDLQPFPRYPPRVILFFFFVLLHPAPIDLFVFSSSSFSSCFQSSRILVEIMQDSHPETQGEVRETKLNQG